MNKRTENNSEIKLGRKGEDLALVLCREKGFIIVEQNYRTPMGEIDIIAKDGELYVFIEVKTRRGNAYGAPFEAVTQRKREKIKKVALSYMKRFKKEVPARFDVISISMKGNIPSLDYIQDAFEV